jgi:hypothetical protein
MDAVFKAWTLAEVAAMTTGAERAFEARRFPWT